MGLVYLEAMVPWVRALAGSVGLKAQFSSEEEVRGHSWQVRAGYGRRGMESHLRG